MTKDNQLKPEDIVFKDFSQSVTAKEFLAVLELVGAINDKFEQAIEKANTSRIKEFQALAEMEEEKGKYSKEAMSMRKVCNRIEHVQNEEIGKSFKQYLKNYDGAIEFLTRFNLCGTIKKRNINKYIRKDEERKSKED